MVVIRCYKTNCINNDFSRVNCGYCKKGEVWILKNSCADFETLMDKVIRKIGKKVKK